ncbi:hypothetical protein VCR15J2_390090 [Vibrio coralliirubri]|uniref:hypothetical protein n=1 Tax=Vibrio coralliirubri TaxID=1516159 RepID=UPI0006317663|nr:hypothetical protein [Vibrio coralliirubri]CDT53657.1 hypothetical protein VCR15J2_390090 [Vibrio coralliirubri]
MELLGGLSFWLFVTLGLDIFFCIAWLTERKRHNETRLNMLNVTNRKKRDFQIPSLNSYSEPPKRRLTSAEQLMDPTNPYSPHNPNNILDEIAKTRKATNSYAEEVGSNTSSALSDMTAPE